MAVSPAISGVIWKYLLQFQIGPVNYLLEILGFERQQFLSSFTLALPSVIVMQAWTTIPRVFLFLYPARITFPEELYEAASIDGASGWQKFRYITFPLLKPVFMLCLVFRTMYTLRTFGAVWILTKGGPLGSTELLAIYMFKEGFQSWRLGAAASVAWIMLLITMVAASYQIYRMYQNVFIKDTM
jgi:multiple sugar transport system permease protein